MMKALSFIAVAALLMGNVAQAEEKRAEPRHDEIDETSRFIFYSVLEGLYEDGLSNKDVDQILLKKESKRPRERLYRQRS